MSEIAKMLVDYDEMPAYACNDERYAGCLSAEDARILRLLLTYVEFVQQRYGDAKLRHLSFVPDAKGKSLRTNRPVYTVAKLIAERLGDRDPADFMSYVFEAWDKRHDHRKLEYRGWQGVPGLAYPAWTHITAEHTELVEGFLARPNYKPQKFVSFSKIDERWGKALENKTKRWCAATGGTPRDYWLGTPRHIFPPHLHAKEIKFARWLQEHQEEFEETYGLTLEEHEEVLQQHEARVNVHTLENHAWMDDYTLERINYITDALEEGRDVTTNSFEEEVEDAINPIDLEDPSTVVYLMTGHGDLRREYDG